ncbi:hypothetical protein HanRHA438_Chr03g0101151 [Helianthus annuus]|nr:hypothetical protein HanHA89_Chr03g0086341 [Helianthus annuus]KAJ0933883.1 hypothetical protein HanRHA438_Chr03g0101151 [Helianthus annuus]
MLYGGFEKTIGYWPVCVLYFCISLHPHHHSDTTPSPHISNNTHPFPSSSTTSYLRYKTRRRRERTMFEEIERRESRCRKREPTIDD